MCESTIFIVSLILSTVGTGMVREYALRTNLVDIPNQRSSHNVATPRGGGLAVATVFLGGLLALYLYGKLSLEFFLPLLSFGLLVAGIGFIDDRGDVATRWRLAAHFIAAIGTLTMLGGLPPIEFGESAVQLGILGNVLAIFLVVWMINLFNFMDGIDGIAAVEAICVTGGAWLIAVIPEGSFVGPLLGMLVASLFGFLVWNWPRAKIFMGDVGSGFLGFVISVLAITTAILGILPVWSWLILSGVFVVDATLTLVVRVLDGQTWHEAHNYHAYQKLARKMSSHAPVTLLVLAINIVWLLPLAWVSARSAQYGWWLTLLAWFPLGIVAIGLRAGHPDVQEFEPKE